jgi:tRNA1Val (adenine37-N6)-methyltransferase
MSGVLVSFWYNTLNHSIMSSDFKFQQFSIAQDKTAMKLGIDSVLLGAWCPVVSPHKILDIGTGTGILSLMLAQRTTADIDAVEIEDNAYLQAKGNVQNSKFNERITLYHLPVQEFNAPYSYDVIISNPPYFKDSLLPKDQGRAQARHGHTLSYDDLFVAAAKMLSIDGSFSLILPIDVEDEVFKVAKANQLFCSHFFRVVGRRGKQPNRMLLSFMREESDILKGEIVIYDSPGKYSEQFRALTKAFYLPSTFR